MCNIINYLDFLTILLPLSLQVLVHELIRNQILLQATKNIKRKFNIGMYDPLT